MQTIRYLNFFDVLKFHVSLRKSGSLFILVAHNFYFHFVFEKVEHATEFLASLCRQLLRRC